MLRHHIHRVVVAEGDQVHGVLEALDVFSFLSNHSMLITLRINDADSIDELAEAAGQVTGMIGRQFRSGTRVGLIARMVQDLNARLFDRAVMHARNHGVNMLFIHALSENTAMLKIARNAGATVERDGSESEAHLYLPAPSLDSRMAELVARQYAEVDYSLKKQAKQFWDVLARLQALRQDVPTHESAREPAHHGD